MLLRPTLAHHFFIRFQRDLKDVSLLRLGQEEEHGLGLVGGRTDEYHPSLWVIEIILKEQRGEGRLKQTIQI